MYSCTCIEPYNNNNNYIVVHVLSLIIIIIIYLYIYIYIVVHVLSLIIIIIIIHVLFYCVWDFLVGGVYLYVYSVYILIGCIPPRAPCLHSLYATHFDPCPNW